MRKVLPISVLSFLLFESALTLVLAQDRLMECNYEESLTEVVPESFICGYTFSPYGYKHYGIFLVKEDSAYKAVLNYYKYDRDKVDDEMSSATLDVSEWRANDLIDAAQRDIDQALEITEPDPDASKNVVKVIKHGKAVQLPEWNILNIPWCDVFYEFKQELGPEPMTNANRWEVTPYYNPAETSSEEYHWISSNDMSNYAFVLYEGDYIFGTVFADYWGCGGCVVSEIDNNGNVVNATCTDERGRFRLRVMDPNGLIIQATLCHYDQKRGKFVKYKPCIKKIAEKKSNGGGSSSWYSVHTLQYYINLDNAKAARQPMSLKENIIIAGRKPCAGESVDGVVMNAIGPLKDAVITERDLNGNAISETTTGANGEFKLESVNPDNILCISCEGYADIRQQIDGDRFIVTMKQSDKAASSSVFKDSDRPFFQFSIFNSQFICLSLQSHNKGDEHQERN